jgi:hypothetical protein
VGVEELAMQRTSKMTIATATALFAALGGMAVYARDKYALKSPDGIAVTPLIRDKSCA